MNLIWNRRITCIEVSSISNLGQKWRSGKQAYSSSDAKQLAISYVSHRSGRHVHRPALCARTAYMIYTPTKSMEAAGSSTSTDELSTYKCRGVAYVRSYMVQDSEMEANSKIQRWEWIRGPTEFISTVLSRFQTINTFWYHIHCFFLWI